MGSKIISSSHWVNKFIKTIYQLNCRFPGGLKEILAKDLHEKDQTKVIHSSFVSVHSVTTGIKESCKWNVTKKQFTEKENETFTSLSR